MLLGNPDRCARQASGPPGLKVKRQLGPADRILRSIWVAESWRQDGRWTPRSTGACWRPPRPRLTVERRWWCARWDVRVLTLGPGAWEWGVRQEKLQEQAGQSPVWGTLPDSRSKEEIWWWDMAQKAHGRKKVGNDSHTYANRALIHSLPSVTYFRLS